MQQNSFNNYIQSPPVMYNQPVPLNNSALGAHQGMMPMYQSMPQQIAPVQTMPQAQIPNNGPNAVSINIIAPQAYASNPLANNITPNGYYSMYGQNTCPQPMYYYPQNYNNLINTPAQDPNTGLREVNNTQLIEKTPSQPAPEPQAKAENKNNKTKKVVPLTDDYVKSLENYLNDDNPKVRLIGAKELMQRFKEDDNRKDHPSLIPLLNKTLKDPNAAVRFLGLTTLQLGYSVGNDETVKILKDIQATTENKMSEDSILASEVLLKLCAPEAQDIIDNTPDKPKKAKETEGD